MTFPCPLFCVLEPAVLKSGVHPVAFDLDSGPPTFLLTEGILASIPRRF